MISEDALLQVSATIIVGILFVISVRQALGFRTTGSFFLALVTLAIVPFALTAILVLTNELAYARLAAIIGFCCLVVLLYVVAWQTRSSEMRVR